MSLATRLAAKVVDSIIGAQTLWLEYRTSAPTPANGEMVGATCDSAGNLNVALQSGGTSGSAVPSRVTQVGGPDGSGLLRALLMSAAGIAQVSAAKGTSNSSTALEASRVISASACMPSRASMLNTNASVRYLQIFNTTSLPANGAVPIDSMHCTTGQRAVITYSIPTDRCGTGLTVAFSSTSNTLTIGAAEALFTVDLYPANS